MCWAHGCAAQKRLNRSWCRLGGWLTWVVTEPCVRWDPYPPQEGASAKGDRPFAKLLWGHLILSACLKPWRYCWVCRHVTAGLGVCSPAQFSELPWVPGSPWVWVWDGCGDYDESPWACGDSELPWVRGSPWVWIWDGCGDYDESPWACSDSELPWVRGSPWVRIWDGCGDCDESPWACGDSMGISNGFEIKRKLVKPAINVVVDVWISPNAVQFLICLRAFFIYYHYWIVNTHSNTVIIIYYYARRLHIQKLYIHSIKTCNH